MGWVGWRYAMRYPKRQRCHYGGYGEGRARGCVATASKVAKERRFLKVDEFIHGLRRALEQYHD